MFLALGLGIVAGSTFVSPETIKTLNNALRRIDTSNRALQADNDTLAQANRNLLRYAEASRNLLVQGKLAGKPAVLISFDTTPGGEASQMASTLVAAGAKLQGSIALSSNLGLPDDASRQLVVGIVGGALTGAEAVQALLAHQLAEALAGRTPGIFQHLVDAGLAARGQGAAGDSPQPPATLAVPGSIIVVLAPAQPGTGAKAGPDLAKTLILPMVRELSADQVLVAAGEDGTSPVPALAPIRQDPGLRVVTADTVDQPMGQAAVVLGLAEMLAGRPSGAYGMGPGANAPLPTQQPAAPPTPPTSPSVSPTHT